MFVNHEGGHHLEALKYVGKSITRIDAVEKVLGIAEYASDIELPGMLYAKLLLSPYAHAKIISINYEKALRVPGVVSVAVGDDFPFRVGLYVNDRNILARKKVRWVGEPVAAVVAEDLEAAEEAVELIEVEYEPLPAVLDVREALKPGAPLVHEELGEYAHSPAFNPIAGTNIANRFTLKKGNIVEGFNKSEVVVENEFYMPQVSHVQMETHVCIGHYMADGNIKIWTSAQSPFTVRYILSHSIGVPLHRISVYVPYVGGGFGGKAGINFEPLVVLLSKKAGYRPVKLELTREEHFLAAPLRQGFYAKIKTGVTRDGKIMAEKIFYAFDAGAYADYGVNVARAAGYSCTGPYYVPNIEAESLAVYTNHQWGTAFRGFGHFEFLWAVERQMEIVASKLGIDPVEFRLKNALLPGLTTATGEVLREDAGRVDQCIEAVAKELRWGEPTPTNDPKKVRAKGIAALWKAPAMPPNAASSAIIKFNEDGTVLLSVGVTEIGQGTVTSLAQIAAEELGVPIEKIRVVPFRHTDLTPYSWQTVASRNLFMEGRAVIRAARDAKEQILEIASQVLRAPKDDLIIKDEKVWVKGRPEWSLHLKDIVAGYVYPNGNTIGGPIIGRGYFVGTRLSYLDPETGQGYPALKWTFGAQGVEIELDLETGEVKVLKLVSAFDVGKAINPMLVIGQIIGGGIQSLSLGMWEQYVYDDKGRMLNPNLTDYKIARAGDIPEEIIPIIIENPQSDGPYGARGVAELSMLSVPAAIANAIFHATGVNINDLPLTYENIWKALNKKR
ncbi:MAG: xanthine dehydrogenase family protein molybdopterin-binding subunit [Thaumarchaeota archaeon]|jgi:CO/xanthine dehydrogenase Mo-binding subunit|nr:xanthine dehydrogenase family protein molybdopterin-binding subunit [Candidatus Geocrenenecus arthurdayi]